MSTVKFWDLYTCFIHLSPFNTVVHVCLVGVLWVYYDMYNICNLWLLCPLPLGLGPIAIYPAAYHALNGRVVHEGGAV